MSQPAAQPATPEQIAAFKQGAADTYTARGVKPADADRLFDTQLQKLAGELGVDKPELTPGATKAAEIIRGVIATKK